MKSFFRFMKGNVLVLTTTQTINSFFYQMIMPFLSIYILSLHGTEAVIGFVFALGILAGIFVYPIAGYLADHTNRVRLIGTMGVIFSLTYLFYVFAQHWSMLAVGSFLGGFVVFHVPSMSALLADSLSPKQRGAGFATVWAIPGAIGIVSPYVAGVLIVIYGIDTTMRYLYTFAIIAGIVTSIIHIKFLKETTKAKSDISIRNILSLTKSAYANLWGTIKWMPKNVRLIALVLALSFLFNSIAGPFWIVYGQFIIGLNADQWGLILLISSAISVALTIPAGAITDILGKRKSLILGLSLLLPPVFFFVYSSTFIEVLLVFAVLSVVNSFLIPACSAFITDNVPRRWRGRVMALMGRGVLHVWSGGYPWGGASSRGFLLSIPMMAGFFIAGYIYSFNPTYPWFLLSASIALSLIVALVLLREPKEPQL